MNQGLKKQTSGEPKRQATIILQPASRRSSSKPVHPQHARQPTSSMDQNEVQTLIAESTPRKESAKSA